MTERATKRIKPATWIFLRENFPDDVAKMCQVSIPVNRFGILLKKYRRKTNDKRAPKTNKQRFGSELGEILDWLEENCNGQFYAQWKGNQLAPSSVTEQVVEFFFMEETDAVGFRLMFE